MGDSGPKPGPHVRFWPSGSHKCSCRVGPIIAGQEAACNLFITLRRPHLLTLTRKECGLLARNPDVHPLQIHHSLLCLEQGTIRGPSLVVPQDRPGKKKRHWVPRDSASLSGCRTGSWRVSGAAPFYPLCFARLLQLIPLSGRQTLRYRQDPGEQRQKPSFSGQFELISDPFPLLFFSTFSVFCFIMRCWICFIYVMEMKSHQL